MQRLRTNRPYRGWIALGISTCLLAACGGGSEESGGAKSSASKSSATATKTAPAVVDLGPNDPILGYEVVIEDERITHDMLRRYLCHGEAGIQILEARKLQAILDMELARRKEAGEDIAKYDVTDEEVEKSIKRAKKQVREEFPENPEVDLGDVVNLSDDDLFRLGVRQARQFDKLFLPDNPNEYPDLTVATLTESMGGSDLIDQLKTAYDDRQAKLAAGEVLPDDGMGQEFLRQMLRQMLLEKLDEFHAIKFPEDGIPVEYAMVIDGHGIPVDEVWANIEGKVSAAEIEAAKQWFVNITLAKKALESSGYWLDDEEFARIYAEEHDPYKDSPFSLEAVALNFKNFPSVSSYRLHYRVLQSYKKMIADELTDEALARRSDRIDLLVAGKIDVDIILISAYDFKEREWKENGWADAEVRAMEVIQKLSEGLAWEDAVEQYSEFYDAPIPASRKDDPQVLSNRYNKGRFVGTNRNQLLGKLEESDFSAFLNGSTVGDYVFYEQAMGTVNNPLKGPRGYYIPKLYRRSIPKRSVTVENETHRALLEQDMVFQRLNRFIWELKQEAPVYGL